MPRVTSSLAVHKGRLGRAGGIQVPARGRWSAVPPHTCPTRTSVGPEPEVRFAHGNGREITSDTEHCHPLPTAPTLGSRLLTLLVEETREHRDGHISFPHLASLPPPSPPSTL